MVRSVTWRTSSSMMKPGRFDTSRWTRGTGGLAKRCWCHPSGSNKVSWPDSKVYVHLSRETIKNGPEYIESMPITREYENRLYDYYGRPAYWLQQSEQPSSRKASKG